MCGNDRVFPGLECATDHAPSMACSVARDISACGGGGLGRARDRQAQDAPFSWVTGSPSHCKVTKLPKAEITGPKLLECAAKESPHQEFGQRATLLIGLRAEGGAETC